MLLYLFKWNLARFREVLTWCKSSVARPRGARQGFRFKNSAASPEWEKPWRGLGCRREGEVQCLSSLEGHS